MRRSIYIVIILWLWSCIAMAQDPSPSDLDWLRAECGDGALAYQAGDPNYRIYLTELSTGQTQDIGPGVKPEFSPDSSKLAWLDGSTAKGRMRKGDTTIHTIATGVSEDGGIHWVSKDELMLVKSGRWFRVSLSGKETEVPALTALGAGGSECDVKQGGDGVWSYVTGDTWKTSDGHEGGTGGTCSCSLSPDGKSVTGLQHGHKTCMLTQARPGGVSGELHWVYDYSGEKGFDNHRWSSNDSRFVAMQDEKYNYMVIMKVGGTYCTRMGLSSSGEMYGDFAVGDGSGDPWVSDEPELDIIEISPSKLTLLALDSAQFTATARDQFGKLFPTIFTWSTSGGGSMNPASSGSATSQHSSTFSSDGTLGVFQINASSGGIDKTATVNVVSESEIHMKVNCGDDAFTPTGWENDGPYLQGGADFVFPDDFDTSGVSDAAPAQVYKTCRHRIRGQESSYGYDFSSLPDGDYTVRLHFGDGLGPRSIDVWIEGQERISDLDIVTEAGGAYKALVKDVQVSVSDGDGMQIELTDDRAEPADFFVNGIEIISATGNQPPEVDAGVDQIIELGHGLFLDGTVTDDGLPNGSVSSVWTKAAGPSGVTFENSTQEDTQVLVDSAGAYTFRLSADDGQAQAFDEVDVTVTEPPSIEILSPKGGELWEVGSTQKIRWTTVSLTDVQIDYSTDDGESFENITSSVDTDNPQWGEYLWQVPNEPSTRCKIKISGYYGEVPTLSDGQFEIRSSGSDGGTTDDVSGGCSCSSSGHESLFTIILALLTLAFAGSRNKNLGR